MGSRRRNTQGGNPSGAPPMAQPCRTPRLRVPMKFLYLLPLAVLLVLTTHSPAQTQYQWTNFAGMPGGAGNADGQGAEARLNQPWGLAFDAQGNLLVADQENFNLRLVTPGGAVSTLCGGDKSYWPGVQVKGVAVDAAGAIYVANGRNILKVTPDGVRATFVGGTSGYADGLGATAQLYSATGLAFDPAGNLYFTDSYHNMIRKVTPAGQVSLFSGGPATDGSNYGSNDGSATNARFNVPTGLASDGSFLYVTDSYNSLIRKVSLADGSVSTLAGNTNNYNAGQDGTASAATFSLPQCLTVGVDGNLYVSDTGDNTIRKIAPAGVVTTIAGQAGVKGSADGQALTTALFNAPAGILMDAQLNLYVADQGNSTLRKITPGGIVSTLAGLPPSPGAVNDTGSKARFNGPHSVAVDADGTVYVVDGGQSLRKISAQGVVTNMTGPAAPFYDISDVCVDSARNVYLSDTYNYAVWKITPGAVVTRLAGGSYGSNNGQGSAAQFNNPSGVAVDSAGVVYVADQDNDAIRRIAPDGTVSTLAGSPGNSGSTDGTGSSARFYSPRKLGIDGAGNLYVMGYDGDNIRKVTPAGVVTTLNVLPYYHDFEWQGNLGLPRAICADAAGNIYVTNTVAQTVIQISPAGVVRNLGGSPYVAGHRDGLASLGEFNGPEGIAISAAGDLYVADQDNNRIVKGTLVQVPQMVVEQPAGTALTDGIGTVDFGAVATGGTMTKSFTIRNTGGAALSLSAAAPGGVNGGDFSLATAPAASVAEGASTTFTITFAPAAAGPRGGELSITSNDPLHLVFKLTLTGFGGSEPSGVGQYLWSTFVGAPGGFGSDDGTGSVARFSSQLGGLVTDAAGNAYVMDTNNFAIRKIAPGGVVTTYAGRPGYFIPGDGPAGTATLSPTTSGMAWDGAGTLYFTDGSVVRKVTSDGTVTTVAGGLYSSSGYVDQPGPAARFRNPSGLAFDAAGNLYVADTFNHVIRKITPSGVVSTFAGTAGTYDQLDGTGASAHFSSPAGMTSDPAGTTLYVLDGASALRKIVVASAAVSTLAGGTLNGFADGTGSAARFSSPKGLAVAADGSIYVADTGNRAVRKVTAAGVVTTLAGGYGLGYGIIDGLGSNAQFSGVSGIALTPAGDLLVADGTCGTIRAVTTAGLVSTYAGLAPHPGDAETTGGSVPVDGVGLAARLSYPAAITTDAGGNLLLGEWGAESIRRVTLAGVTSVIAANYSSGPDLDLRQISGLAMDSTGTILGVDNYHQVVVKVDAQGGITDFAGSRNNAGTINGQGTAAKFYQPWGSVLMADGSLVVADSYNYLLRKITAAGLVSTYAGAAGSSGSTNGGLTTARFSQPRGLARDAAGNLYVADSGNNLIRKITAGGTVSTLAGQAGHAGSADGAGATAATFNTPSGLCVDAAGNVFVADTGNNTIRRITLDGMVTTVGGLASVSGGREGTGAAARFDSPMGIALGAHNVLYVADYYGNRVVRGVLMSLPTLVVQKAGASLSSGGTADFGAVRSGGSTSVAFTIKNTGTAALSGLGFTIDGANAGDFAIKPPAPGSVAAGGSATLTVTFAPAAGGTRTAVLHIASNDPSYQPSFDVTLTGSGLTVPAITTPPASAWTGTGQAALFTVNASGGGLGYQWYKNNAAISKATAASYSIAAATTASAGAYMVKATNASGSITSTANLGVVNLATTPVLVAEGGTISLTVSAAAPGITYHWQKNGSPLANGVNPLNTAGTIAEVTAYRLTITKASLADTDSYSCLVSMPDLQHPGTLISHSSGPFTVKVLRAPIVTSPQNMPDGIVSGSYVHQIQVDSSPERQPASYAVSGLPSGVTYVPTSGVIIGAPRVAGTFNVKITATNLKGVSTAVIDTIHIAPFPAGIAGNYAGPVARDAGLNNKLGGRVDFTIAGNGLITGRLSLGAAAAVPLTFGSVNIDVAGIKTPTATVGIFRTGTPLPLPLLLTFGIDTTNAVITSGSLTDTTHTAAVQGWRNTWIATTHPATAYLGYRTFGLTQGTADPSLPQGTGFGSFTVAAAGTLSAVQKLADGSAVTSSAFVGPQGQVLVHQLLYGNTGSYSGVLSLATDTTGSISGSPTWYKAPAATASKDRVYRSGFGPLTLSAFGGKYIAPTAGHVVMGLPNQNANAQVSFTGGGLSQAPGSPPDAVVSVRNLSTTAITNTVTPPSPNPDKLLLAITSSSGLFSGSFLLTGTPESLNRTVTYQGAIIYQASGPVAQGWFLLPHLPITGQTLSTSPELSGKVSIGVP